VLTLVIALVIERDSLKAKESTLMFFFSHQYTETEWFEFVVSNEEVPRSRCCWAENEAGDKPAVNSLSYTDRVDHIPRKLLSVVPKIRVRAAGAEFVMNRYMIDSAAARQYF
jgi:hypothetical protein